MGLYKPVYHEIVKNEFLFEVWKDKIDVNLKVNVDDCLIKYQQYDFLDVVPLDEIGKYNQMDFILIFTPEKYINIYKLDQCKPFLTYDRFDKQVYEAKDRMYCHMMSSGDTGLEEKREEMDRKLLELIEFYEKCQEVDNLKKLVINLETFYRCIGECLVMVEHTNLIKQEKNSNHYNNQVF